MAADSVQALLLRVFIPTTIYIGYQMYFNNASFDENLLSPVLLLIGLQFILFTFSYVMTVDTGAVVGKPAAKLNELKFVQGEPVDVDQGQVTVVEFWATWCPPCRTSIPHLSKVYDTYRNQGVRIVGVTVEDEQRVTDFVNQMKKDFRYPVAVDSTHKVSKGYPHSGIPHAVVVGKDGLITWTGHPMNGLEAAIEKALTQASGKPKAE